MDDTDFISLPGLVPLPTSATFSYIHLSHRCKSANPNLPLVTDLLSPYAHHRTSTSPFLTQLYPSEHLQAHFRMGKRFRKRSKRSIARPVGAGWDKTFGRLLRSHVISYTARTVRDSIISPRYSAAGAGSSRWLARSQGSLDLD